MDKDLKLKKGKDNTKKEDLSINKPKKHKAFGALKKYANPLIIGHEREIMAKALAEEYIRKEHEYKS